MDPNVVVPQTKAASLPKSNDGISPNAISLPSGGGTIGGMGESFSAQLTTGIATYTVPFAVPAARGAVTPNVGLVYSSGGGLGVAGLGWGLTGQVAIARQSDRRLPQYQDQSDWHPEQDRFVFGTDELVPICKIASGTCSGALPDEVMPVWANGWQYFRARVEGSFLRFFWSPDHETWRVQSKDGANLELGKPLDGTGYLGALEANPSDAGEIYRWHLVRQYDSRGGANASGDPSPVNLAVYRYVNDGAIAYLSDIFHTPPAAQPSTTDLTRFAHHVRFAYEPRADASTSFRAGFEQEQGIRLAHVDVTSKPFDSLAASARELVRRYHLDYEPGTHAALLASVQTEGRCETPIQEASDEILGPTSCPRLPKISFQYQHVSGSSPPLEDPQGLAFEPLNETIHQLTNSPPHSLDESNTSLTDVNADSLPDVVVTAPAIFGGKHGLFLNGAGGTHAFASVSGMGVTGVQGVDPNILKLSNSNVNGLDLDGDARIDLVHMPKVKTYSVFTPKLLGSEWTWVGREVSTASGLSPKIDFTTNADRTAMMDVNGDGLVDVVFSSALETQTFFSLGRFPNGDGRFGRATLTGPETASFSDDPATACVPWSATPIHLGDDDVRVADMNGDGLPDFARLRSGQVFYWPGRGNGFWGTGKRDDCAGGQFGQNRQIEMTNPPNFGVVQSGTLELADVNGDGLADLLEARFDAVDVYLNVNGRGWTDRQILAKVPIKPNVGNIFRVADVDGSGTVDLVWGQGYDYRYIDLAGSVRPQVLVRVENGVGKTTELEYASSTNLMLDAAANGTPWTTVMPLTVPVLVRSTVRDNLEKLGRPAGVYVTEYVYRDPVFDGRQREFRGFSLAETRVLGDSNSPTSTTRSTFLLGECTVAQNGFDACSPGQSWRDNWREALKGLPVLVEVYDENGIYPATAHTTYELRQLYTGRDARRVSAVLVGAQESFVYDTSPFVPAPATTSLDEVVVNVTGIAQTETRAVTKRAAAVNLRARMVVDSFGNGTESIDEGCVAGCAPIDESITSHSSYDRPSGDASGWQFRVVSTFVTGSVHTQPRHHMFHEYDAAGDLAASKARLSGTLALNRFHAGGGATALSPPESSGGVGAPVDIVTLEYTRDAFGNVIGTRSAGDRCRSVGFDTPYAALPVIETIFAGERGSDSCGTRELSTTASYDRGLGLLTELVGVTGQPSRLAYDEFGRAVSQTFADPNNPGHLAALPTVTYNYSLPIDATATPYSTVLLRKQDGASPNDAEYHEQYSLVDGLGRPLAVLSEADPASGDAGDWVVQGVRHYDAKGGAVRSFNSYFHTGGPGSLSLGAIPPSNFTSNQYDAFGRCIASYGFDGLMKSRSYFHALSRDVWDAEDLSVGAHQGTFATVTGDGHGRAAQTTERIRIGGLLQERHQLREFLPTGETTRITQRTAGAPDAVRWMRYDSLGRLVLNAEPNTSVGFSTDPNTDPSTIKAWRYAYNDAGDVVGTSDARGCGVNYHFDAAGRLVAEDFSPCEANHDLYSEVTSLATGAGTETSYRYDVADPETPSIIDASGHGFPIDATQLPGRLTSTVSRGVKSVVRYDARGRVTGSATRIAKPAGGTPGDPSSYAPRWYIQDRALDAGDRATQLTTGATVPELLGSGNLSSTAASFTRRGTLHSVNSTYGALVTSQTYSADGLVTSVSFGDKANTQRAFAYDQLRRLHSAQTYRAQPEVWNAPGYPGLTDLTQQLLLEDQDLTYDEVGNVTEIKDWRPENDWPSGAKPVSRKFEYDDLYRITRAKYEHPGGTDSWSSPFAAENSDATRQPQPSPHVGFVDRVREQRWSYDHLGNTTRTTDDSSGFFDRSLGEVQNGSVALGPHRLVSASNRVLAPTSPRKGDLSAAYDSAGNLIALITRRDGPCLPSAASCWQRFAYTWDELGRLDEARRWDLATAERAGHDDLTENPPTRNPDVLLRHLYDGGGQRVLKTAIDTAGVETHTVYIFSTLELRGAAWTSGSGTPDYASTSATETVILPAGGLRARVIFAEEDLPSLSVGHQHVFLESGDYLGSTAIEIDHATGELVERADYTAYGGVDSDYRPGRWASFREPYKFTGKEEDIEVGLSYFGSRYLANGLGRWASPDPATIHAFRSDPNPYAYVAGRPTVAVDPNGNEPITIGVILTAALIGAAVGATAATTAYIASNGVNMKSKEWRDGLGTSAGIGAVAGGVAGGLTMGTGALVGVELGLAMPSMGQALAMGVVGGASNSATSTALSGGSDRAVANSALIGGALGAGIVALGGLAGLGATAKRPSAPSGGSAAEALATGVGQGGAAYAYQKLTGGTESYAAYAAASAGFNGMRSGALGIYNWENPSGWLAAGLDATTGITGTTIGNAAFMANAALGASYYADESRRSNMTVFNGGIVSPAGSGTTFGNVFSSRYSGVARSSGILAHESVHVWQSRVYGGAFYTNYLNWFVGGTIAASVYAPFAGENFENTAMNFGYFNNPYEQQGYRSQGGAHPSWWHSSGRW